MEESDIVREIIVHIISHNSTCVHLEKVFTAFDSDCLRPTVKHGGGAFVTWASNLLVFCRPYHYPRKPSNREWLCGQFSQPVAPYGVDIVSI
ncbi:hypothetical protein AVEN_40405-1 [Araneus ventricosus]|uniref:Uncharacterized protein n=1 Tax=Araneus ventricosus TaxID=182803 RepID=A0A4Y2DC53_ARAVE|nr:hypothetical protein AVEN_40405-1 [Araneus ventricosus]